MPRESPRFSARHKLGDREDEDQIKEQLDVRDRLPLAGAGPDPDEAARAGARRPPHTTR
jgi:hypothetical protein